MVAALCSLGSKNLSSVTAGTSVKPISSEGGARRLVTVKRSLPANHLKWRRNSYKAAAAA